MNCSRCKTTLKVEQTLTCPAGKVQRLVCKRRGCPTTVVSVVLVVQEVTARGTGLHALMKKLKAGRVSVKVV